MVELRAIAIKEGVEAPTLHSFRRSYALDLLCAGVDIFSLKTLMGHADLQVLRRYLKQTEGDLQAARVKGGPADRIFNS